MPVWIIIIGIVILLTFVLSVFAAMACLELYALLRTGTLGRMWRILTVAMIFFALYQLLSLGERMDIIDTFGAVYLLQLAFIGLLCYGFWQQRQAFFATPGIRRQKQSKLRRWLKLWHAKRNAREHRRKSASTDLPDALADKPARDATEAE